jgi:penicillin-binding protein 1A
MPSLFRFILIAVVLVCATIAGMGTFIAHNKCIDFSALEQYDPGTPTILLDDEGNEWARFQLDRREPIAYAAMPDHLINAFIAAEDWSFFTHSGISWRGIFRSMLVNLYHGRIVQGASTITQQLVKLLFLDSKKTFTRKIKEQCSAFLVEQQFSKQQILETYLNHIYFGHGIYGVQAACQRFWGIDAAQISLDQAATLAAIVRSPRNYCPLVHPLSAQSRRDVILQSMLKLKFITPEAYAAAQAREVGVVERQNTQCAVHLKETMRQWLEEQYGREMLYSGGLVVQTTLNREIQQKAESTFHETVSGLKKTLVPEIDGALITMETQTGAIKALIGGYDFSSSQFNRALQAKRQVGSTFKPLVYAAAIARGKQFSDCELDEPFELESGNSIWKPNNFNHIFAGEMTLAYALSHSNNIVTIKTFLEIGSDPVIELAKKCHLTGALHPYPSLALGCIDDTLDVVTAMFNVFAHDGVYVEPHYMKWVKDKWGSKIWRYTPRQERVIPSDIVGQVAKVLEHGLQRIRSIFAHKWFDGEAISKTGTTNDSRTCWFIGSTPRLTTGIYVGCDDNRSLGRNVFPLRTAFPIWLSLYHAIQPAPERFTFDSSLKEYYIHEKTGLRVSSLKEPGAVAILRKDEFSHA